MRVIKLDMSLAEAKILAEALYQHLDAWGTEMENEEHDTLDKLHNELARQIRA